MAKKTATNIVEVWSWLVNVIEDGTLNATEQAVLVHVIAKLNRNLWTPARINSKLIAAAIDKDPRTVKKALDKIINLNILTDDEGEIYFGNKFKHNPISKPDSEQRFQFKNSRNAETDSCGTAGADNGSGHTQGTVATESTQPARRRRKIFDETPAD